MTRVLVSELVRLVVCVGLAYWLAFDAFGYSTTPPTAGLWGFTQWTVGLVVVMTVASFVSFWVATAVKWLFRLAWFLASDLVLGNGFQPEAEVPDE